MAYQVLARRWRPKFFSEIKGQAQIIQALENALSQNKLHHAYLFTGTRGVGKTTLARILAKCLNCEQGISPQPCGHCAACLGIDAGRFVDLIEVDAASRTKVEDTRELLDNVQYAPSSGRFKIYLIDEVHMLSGHSFNALLKTLEEPPPHVKFILATTDPDKIPITVLSRCLRFVLHELSTKEIVAQLTEILTAEQREYEPRALQLIAQAGRGSMRDALGLLEQAGAYAPTTLTVVAVEELLGIAYQRFFDPLLNALANKQLQQAFDMVEQMAKIGAGFTQVLSSLLQALHAIAVLQALNKSVDLNISLDITPEMLRIKDQLPAEMIQLFYQIAIMGKKDLPYAPNPRIGFEMILLRLMIFRPVADAVPEPKALSPQPFNPAPIAPVVPPVAPAAAPAQAASLSINWLEVVPQLGLSGLALILVKNSVLSSWDGKLLVLTLDTSQKACLNPSREAQIQAALSHYMGVSLKLKVLVGELGSDSPLLAEQKQAQLKQEQAQLAVDQDKHLQQILATFDAKLEKITC